MNRTWLVTWWPRLVAAMVVLVVLAPAAVASYLHARHVVSRHDPVMANWLPITTDGMLLAALVVIWARRATRDPAGRWVWLAFWLGGVVTVAANLAAVLPTHPLSLAVEAVVVAVWPPVTVAITLELAMLLAMAVRTAPASSPVLGPKRPSWWQRRLQPGPMSMSRAGYRRIVRVVETAPRVRDTPAEDEFAEFDTDEATFDARLAEAEPVELVPVPTADTPAATRGGPEVAAGAETEPGGGLASQVDTPDQTPPAPPDPEARLYARVVDLMGQGYGRPRVKQELGIGEGKARTLMDRARREWAETTSTNGNGSGRQ